MAYYTKVLRPDETVHFMGRVHWLIYGRALIFLGLTILLLAGCLVVSQNPDNGLSTALAIAALVTGVISLLCFVGAAIRRATTEIVVTDRRVIYKKGLLSRHTVEMNISKIETVDVEQSIAGRVMGFGTVLIRGTGAGFEPLRRIADPLALRSAILVG
jgi:uncharacterized membrane protein YdbT with pleckstrin-like domain